MTKYILAGGCDRLYPEFFKQLARVVETESSQPRILSCWFSNHSDEADEKFPQYRDLLLTFFSRGTQVIKAERHSFMEQVAAADVVYLHGGHTDVLSAAMDEYGDLTEAFEGKMIVGSSAGANYLSRVGYSPGKAAAIKGSGLADIASVVHYGSKGWGGKTYTPEFWMSAVKKVKELSGDRQILLLPEGTFSVIEA